MIRRAVPLLTGIVGVITLILTIPLSQAGYEPFASWYYCISWYSLILFLDSVRTAGGKRSLIFHRPLVFIFLLFWSAVIWFVFEAINFRIANWYYIFVQDNFIERFIGSWLSFGTVLPAIFLIEKLLKDLNLFSKGPRLPFAFKGAFAHLTVILGLICLALPLLFPVYAFPLVWVFGFLLPLPLVKKGVDLVLLKDVEEGRWNSFARLLAAGMICGLIWEFLNSFAMMRWIYTVPFLEDFKLFEMPPLGFLGFPPFALECVVMYALLVALGLAPGLEGVTRKKPIQKKNRIVAVVVGAVGLGFGILVLLGMERYTIDSYVPRLDSLVMSNPLTSNFKEAGVDNCFEAQRLLKNPAYNSSFSEEDADIRKTSDLLDLSLLRGIGTEHATYLFSLNVDSVADLADQDPDLLAVKFNNSQGEVLDRRVRRARINVWIKAAQEYER